MAEAARRQQDFGAELIDINMGCPAKKVLKRAAGSALLADEYLVKNIIRAVVGAVTVPVTLKIRTGPSPERRNAPEIARIAEGEGIAALTVHGRTRTCRFAGHAEYDTLKAVKQQVPSLPVIANGDIDSAEKARSVLAATGADGVMIGRAAMGRPWLLRDVVGLLQQGGKPEPLPLTRKIQLISEHLHALYAFYDELTGVRMARKHLAGYLVELGLEDCQARAAVNKAETPDAQLQALENVIDQFLYSSAV